MKLSKRLREMEEAHGVRAQRGPWEARQRAAIYDLRNNPDLELVEREDCGPTPDGTRLYNRIQAKIALANGDFILPQQIAAWEEKYGDELGFGPPPTPEEQARAESHAMLFAKARTIFAEREKAALERERANKENDGG